MANAILNFHFYYWHPSLIHHDVILSSLLTTWTVAQSTASLANLTSHSSPFLKTSPLKDDHHQSKTFVTQAQQKAKEFLFFKNLNLASSEERWCEGLLLISSAVDQRQRPRLLTPPDQRNDIRENQRNLDRILNRIMECFC